MSALEEALARSERMKNVYRAMAQRRGARARDLGLALTAYRLGQGTEWEQGRCQAYRLDVFREVMDMGGPVERLDCISEARTYVDGTACCQGCADFLGCLVDTEDRP